MRDLAELNINEGGEPVRRAPPTLKEIAAFERHFNVKIPEDLLVLLSYSNGGHPELDTVEPVGRPGASEWSVNEFYFLSNDRTSFESLWKAMAEWRRVLGTMALPFAEDGGGNQFFLDLTTMPASVKVCIHDENFLIVEIAPSLEVFIDRLHIDPDAI